MRKGKDSIIKLRSIQIENYKGIDSLTMDFPKPMLSGDPDILVMGSENGLGKTSIIECSALLLFGLSIGKSRVRLRVRSSSINIPDLLIRAGTKGAKIIGYIIVDNKDVKIELNIAREGMIEIINDKPFRLSDEEDTHNSEFDEFDAVELIESICGFWSNPIIIKNSFLLFHSYRKIQEGNPELGKMVRDSREFRRIMPPNRRMEMPLSEFKLLMLRLLMTKAKMIEIASKEEPVEIKEESDKIIDKLNKLVNDYAGGTIKKLRLSKDNTVDFRVTQANGGESVTFDGLSSGQKEIISTLFLIWYHTMNNPSIIFIDEPELHLNHQWHRSFINNLMKLAPDNQYIIATHSEDIMDSVPKERQCLLLNEKETKCD